MKLVDDVKITVKAGNGGDGASSKKQAYASKKTIPDGGNGGNGGSVFFKADKNVADLSEFQFKKKIVGNDGTNGGRKDKDGKNGEDITVLVPFGTTIKNLTTEEFVELTTDLPFCIARGGKGGLGNHDYRPFGVEKSSYASNRESFNPRILKGSEGDEYELHLILNLIADIGLVGLPNAGKSSILKALTHATPKIGDYAFTTTTPNLGVLENKVIADIPGLISGASEGKGLGTSFLKHIAKTTSLLHCIDVTSKDPVSDYNLVREEFSEFDENLLEKNEVIVLTKKDLLSTLELEKVARIVRKLKKQVISVSVYDEDSLNKLRDLILSLS